MQKAEKITLVLVTVFSLGWIITSTTAQWEGGGIINASIYQPISASLSDILSKGIFFTNGSTIAEQYPITDMTIENNATHNYACAGSSTCYNVTAGNNQIAIDVYFSACENLKNGTNTINLIWDGGDGGQGAFFANSTTSAAPTLNIGSDYAFVIDTYKLVGKNLNATNSTHLRFWLDPWPNSAPTGIYNTTYKIRAVEIDTNPGTGSC